MKAMKKKILYLIPVLFVLIVVIIVLIRGHRISYSITAGELKQEVLQMNYEMMPPQALQLAGQHDPMYLFVDVRDPVEYARGQIPGSVNIPYYSVLESRELKEFHRWKKEGKTLILYGEDQLQATGPYMILRQTGFDNLKVLCGGYPAYLLVKNAGAESIDEASFLAEEPRYDFPALLEELGGEVSPARDMNPEPVVPVARKKKTTIQGGC